MNINERNYYAMIDTYNTGSWQHNTKIRSLTFMGVFLV